MGLNTFEEIGNMLATTKTGKVNLTECDGNGNGNENGNEKGNGKLGKVVRGQLS